MENGLFGEFTKKREVEQTLGFFPVDQQVQFCCGFVSPGSYCVSETSLNVAELLGLVWEYLMHPYLFPRKLFPATQLTALPIYINLIQKIQQRI